jgi:hypothetical protein
MSGEGTQFKTSLELTITKVEYQGCVGVGLAAIKMNGCDYLFTSGGQMSIKCPEGKKIEWILFGCVATIGSQGPLNGLKFHDAGTTKTELTVESLVKGINGTIDAAAECALAPGAFEGEVMTGNVILTGETDNVEAKMANFWWE